MGEIVERTIRCSEANTAEFLALVNGWPELKALVRSLRALDLFPGLRGLQITLSGPREWVALGVAAVGVERGALAKGGGNAD